jgi:hypothetical protein
MTRKEMQAIFAAMAERAKESDKPWDILERQSNLGHWVPVQLLGDINDVRFPVRIKPPLVRVGKRDIVAPAKFEEMSYGQKYWCPALDGCDLINRWQFGSDSDVDKLIFERGLARLSQDDALDLARALLEITRGEV